MLQLIEIDKTQLSEPVLNFLNEMEIKHAKNPYCLTVRAVQNTYRPEKFWQLRFCDARFAEDEIDWVGVVEWTYGNRNSEEYKVTSRMIQNDRFGHWGNEHSSRRTKDLKKALKIAMDNIVPFEWIEVANKHKRNAEQAHESWKDKDVLARRPFMIGHEGVYEEIKHLLEMGVVFKTPAFKNAAAGIADYEEFMRKQEIKPKFDVVLVRPDKTVYIPHTDTKNPKEVNDIELLPESTRNSVALLKLVSANNLLPEVGYRGGENTYYILTQPS